jgi:hypothetical protein
VDLDAEISKGGEVFKGTIINCSMHGMFLRATQKLELSDIIVVTVFLPDGSGPLTFRSTVIWTDWNEGNPGFGVNFVTISDDHAERLRSFLY